MMPDVVYNPTNPNLDLDPRWTRIAVTFVDFEDSVTAKIYSA